MCFAINIKMRFKKSIRIRNIAFLSMIISVCLFYFIYFAYENYRLNKDFVHLEGVVDSYFWARGMNGAAVRYSFIVDGNLYKCSSRLFVRRDKGKYLSCLLLHKKIPIVYLKGKPGNSDMLFYSKNV